MVGAMAVVSTLNAAASYWPASSWPITFVACSGGFSNILYGFGLGYGLSMTANAALTAAVVRYHRRVPLTPFGLACCGLYAVYGLRLSTFVLRRHQEESYAPKFDELQQKSDFMGLGPKLALVGGVSLSQALYALPLAIGASPEAARARPALRAVGWAGVAIAAAGLLIEHLADEHKLAAKRRDPGPVMDGLYTYSRHPNYFGEFVFHAGISCLGVSGTPLQVAACVFPTFFMAFTLLNSARRLDKEADFRYSKNPNYVKWAASTPVMFPTSAWAPSERVAAGSP